MAIDAQKLWAERYAARYAAEKYREDTAREEAFTRPVFTVCGERIRCMTPRDILILQGIGSPLVYSGHPISPAHIAQFLWCMHVENTCGFFANRARARMMKRLAGLEFSACMAEVGAFIGDMYMDAPGGVNNTDRKPLSACWLAAAMVRLGKIAPHDPFDGSPWCDSPLPRIWQYIKAAAFLENAKAPNFSPSDRLMTDWMEEVNAANKEGATDGI